MSMSKRKTTITENLRRDRLEQASRAMFTVAITSFVLVAVVLAWRVATRDKTPAVSAAPHQPAPIAVPSPTIDPGKRLVGIVSGHYGNDSGAVCPDGLTEADINYAVAREAVALLRLKGINVLLLEEYDSRLRGLNADALVSIHADSCNVPGASGFKVARVTDSAIPQAEDTLVQCITQAYGTETGLPLHPSSITDNMTQYHAFYEVAPSTPGAIIETGFLRDDRDILARHPNTVARGIVLGILCFLDGSD